MKIEEMLKTSLDEMEKMLTSKTVVGEPIQIGENTVVPIVSIGFGFGSGAGEGETSPKGSGGGIGGGGGIKPVALLIVDKNGDIRLESIKGGTASALENIGSFVTKAVEKTMESKRASKAS